MIEEFTAKTNMKLFVLEYDWMASCSRQPTLIYVNSQKKKKIKSNGNATSAKFDNNYD